MTSEHGDEESEMTEGGRQVLTYDDRPPVAQFSLFQLTLATTTPVSSLLHGYLRGAVGRVDDQ